MQRSLSVISVRLIKISLGLIYLWFGILKLFQGMSPAEGLVIRTIHSLSFGSIPDQLGLWLIGIWEIILGFCFLSGFCRRAVLILFFIHMAGTFLPMFFFPEVTFTHFPYSFTIVGQYIFKNIALIVMGWILWENSFRPNPVVK